MTDLQKYCPFIKPTEIIGDLWTILIVKNLMPGSLRFNELKEKIPEINARTLSARLKSLTEKGLIDRKQYPQIPPKVEYSLTAKGQGLQPILQAIEDYGNRFLC
jgi:DNA-binding HxlR family transcriptional regulator